MSTEFVARDSSGPTQMAGETTQDREISEEEDSEEMSSGEAIESQDGTDKEIEETISEPISPEHKEDSS